MESYKLALIIKTHEDDDIFLIVRQERPPLFGDEEYDSLLDSDLWDLPSAPLSFWEDGQKPLDTFAVGLKTAEKFDLAKFDLQSSIRLVLEQTGHDSPDLTPCKFLKLVEEASFGPGFVHTVYLSTHLASGSARSRGIGKWVTIEDCFGCALNLKPSCFRVGPLVFGGLTNDSHLSRNLSISVRYQEYPPGIILVPMNSRTAKPFTTTNLVIVAPEELLAENDDGRSIVHGDALLVDPGCSTDSHDKLEAIVATLPKNLIIFLTHHHRDHVDGLSVIQKVNPFAILVSHDNTMQHIRKDDWSCGHTSVAGGERISVGGQIFEIIYAPGHTDGHMGLHHAASNSLIVGDHCVGEGSAALDVKSGNMKEYFSTTYSMIEASPNVIIPMHGRPNLWPKNMLCGYLRNRRSRESAVLRAIVDGNQTLEEIVARVYAHVDPRIWAFAAANVMLHVQHLAVQDKLPPVSLFFVVMRCYVLWNELSMPCLAWQGFSLDLLKKTFNEFADRVGTRM